MDFNLKVSDQRLMASGLAILAIAGVSVSGVLNFPHSANLGLYATFGLLALLIVIWRQGLGLTADDLQLPFTNASRKNPHHLRWWQGHWHGRLWHAGSVQLESLASPGNHKPSSGR